MALQGKLVLITGAARRVGRSLALACARAGADVAVHYGQSRAEAETLAGEIERLGRRAVLLQADLGDPQAAAGLVEQAASFSSLFALVNNASIFEPLNWQTTNLDDWNRHMAVNLTSPFLLSQAFANRLPAEAEGRIVNLLDWRALRPGKDHFPYTISKAGLAALTRSLAISLAPRITVNALALGAILPPSGGSSNPPEDASFKQHLIQAVPAGRWARLEEVDQALLFLLDGAGYTTGEILHLDGGRHLV